MRFRGIAAAVWLAGTSFSQVTNLRGTVAKQSGSSLDGVQVKVFDSHGKLVSSTASDNLGHWQLSIAAGRYQLKFESDGYRPKKINSVEVPGPPVMVTLASATAENGSADPSAVVYHPVVDPERSDQADFITDLQLSNLPVNVRNYLGMATLTPGVAAVDDYVGITDAPLVQAPQSGLSFGGNNGRGNVFWLDGGENYINTGGVRPSISQEAIAEFHIDRSNYSAEFGGGIGGIVNIISKAGTNDIHGDLFGFLRQSSLQARNYFDPQRGSYTRSQLGGTAGGAIRRDKTFLFLSFERLERQETAYIPVGQDHTGFNSLPPAQQQLASVLLNTGNPQLAQLGGITSQLLVTDHFPATLALLNSNGGMLPFKERSSVGSTRLDHRFSDNHNAFLRFNAGGGNNQNSDIEGFNGYSRGVVSSFSDQTLMLNDTYVISARLVSESRLLINRTRYDIGNRDNIGPSIDIAGYGFFGKDWTLPAYSGEWHFQAQQNFFYSSGRHSIRMGTDINPVRSASVLRPSEGGRFVFDQYLPLGGFYDAVTSDPNTATNLAGLLTQTGNTSLLQALNTPLTALQSFNIGAPGVYIQDFGKGNWLGWFKRYNFFFNDVIRVNSRLTLNAGVRYELEVAPSSLGTDPNNIAPRLGLAWAITGDRRTVLRAGYGIFYLRQQNQIAAATDLESQAETRQVVVPLSGLPGSVNPATGLPVTSADIYQTLLAEGILGRRPIQASDLAQFGIVVQPGMPFGLFFQKPVNFVNAYAEQASLELERAFGGTAVSLAYNFTRAAHLPRLQNLNETYGPPGLLGLPTFVPINPLIGQDLIYESAANSFYHALILQVTRRYRDKLTLDASYTFSKSIDESTDINFLPNDPLNPRADRGLSTFDQRHRVVGSAVITLPGKFTLSPIVTAASGRPFNVVTGLELNELRPVGAGRNIGQGPDFFTIDMRASRTFTLGSRGGKEPLKLEVLVEGFNLLNRTNFRTLNNVVNAPTVNDLPHPLVGVRGAEYLPLSFLSAFDPRVVQLGLKLRW